MGSIVVDAPFAHLRFYRVPKMQSEGWPRRAWIDPKGGLDHLTLLAGQVLNNSCSLDHVEATSESGSYAGYTPGALLVLVEIFGPSFPGEADGVVRHKIGSAMAQIADLAMRLLAYRETNLGRGERDSAPWSTDVVPSIRVGIVVHGRGISTSMMMKRADQVMSRLVQPVYPMVAQ